MRCAYNIQKWKYTIVILSSHTHTQNHSTVLPLPNVGCIFGQKRQKKREQKKISTSTCDKEEKRD